ncbi:MAG: NUDIX hydrolase [Candidatus Paceibacterota bacterium]
MENENVRVIVVAGVAIKDGNKYLLVQDKKPKFYGLWNFPAGKVDVGESIEQAAIRETKEECGYDVELIRKIDIFQKESTEDVKHSFEAKIIGGDLNFPEEKFLDAKWFTFDEIKQIKDKLRDEWVLDSISILENQ